MGFRGRREIIVIAQINGVCVPVVIVLGAFVLGVAIAVQVLMTVLGTATTPTATATAAATAISIVPALAIVLRCAIFILGAVVGGVLIVFCLLIARATTAAAAVPRPSRLCSPLSVWSSFVSSSCVLEEGCVVGDRRDDDFARRDCGGRPRLRFSEPRSSLFSSCVLASEGSGAEGLCKEALEQAS